MDTHGLVKIDHVVLSFLNERNEGFENYMRYKQIVIEGLTQALGVSHSEGTKIYYSVVNVVDNVYLPADYITYSRIGIVINGQIHTLTRNDRLVMPEKVVCGVEEVNRDLLEKLNLPLKLNYAKGGGYNVGEFRVDDRERVIRFRGALAGKLVVVEYKSSGISLDSQTFIPVMMIPTLKEYLEYTLIKRDRDVPEVKVERCRRQYLEAKRQYIKRKNPFNIYDILDVINQGRSQGVK